MQLHKMQPLSSGIALWNCVFLSAFVVDLTIFTLSNLCHLNNGTKKLIRYMMTNSRAFANTWRWYRSFMTKMLNAGGKSYSYSFISWITSLPYFNCAQDGTRTEKKSLLYSSLFPRINFENCNLWILFVSANKCRPCPAEDWNIYAV